MCSGLVRALRQSLRISHQKMDCMLSARSFANACCARQSTVSLASASPSLHAATGAIRAPQVGSAASHFRGSTSAALRELSRTRPWSHAGASGNGASKAPATLRSRLQATRGVSAVTHAVTATAKTAASAVGLGLRPQSERHDGCSCQYSISATLRALRACTRPPSARKSRLRLNAPSFPLPPARARLPQGASRSAARRRGQPQRRTRRTPAAAPPLLLSASALRT